MTYDPRHRVSCPRRWAANPTETTVCTCPMPETPEQASPDAQLAAARQLAADLCDYTEHAIGCAQRMARNANPPATAECDCGLAELLRQVPP